MGVRVLGAVYVGCGEGVYVCGCLWGVVGVGGLWRGCGDVWVCLLASMGFVVGCGVNVYGEVCM